jgi:phosphate starvation-inducible PhoH-like protein
LKSAIACIGFNSKAVVTGDITQIDLPRNVKSGLRHSIEVLSGVDGLSFNFFQSTDVVRHPVVARIVQAYEKFEQQKAVAESKPADREESSS